MVESDRSSSTDECGCVIRSAVLLAFLLRLSIAPSFDWVWAPVGEGLFTVDSDRQKIAAVMKGPTQGNVGTCVRF